MTPLSIAFLANTDWYLFNFRLALARRAREVFGSEVLFICPDGPYRTLLEAEGFSWIPVGFRRDSLNPLPDLAEAVRLARVLRRHRVALLHAFTLKGILTGTVAARLAGIPALVNAVTGLGLLYASNRGAYRLPRWVLTHFLRWTLRRPWIRTVFQNAADLTRLEPRAHRHGFCRVIPGSGVDGARFSPTPHKPEDHRVLLAGRLLRSKGIGTFCAAASLLHARHPRVHFQIAGGPDPGNPDSYDAKALSDLALLHPEVEFLGHIADLPERYREARVAVLPSAYGEGVPRSLVEAAASGLPLVASGGTGLDLLLLDGVNGRRVPPDNPQALAEALEPYLTDPVLAQTHGQASRTQFLEFFEESRVIDATLALYRELGLGAAP